jgi:hypothetical protein
MYRRWSVLAVAAAVSALAACTGSVIPGTAHQNGASPSGHPATQAPTRPTAQTVMPSPAVSDLAATAPADLTAAFARTLFRSAPIVVVAAPGKALAAAGEESRAVHAPLLLAPQATAAPGIAAAQIARLAAMVLALHPRAVLAEGMPAAQRRSLAALLHGVRLVIAQASLPATGTPPPLSRVAVLVVRSGTTALAAAETTAVTATAQAAGATVINVAHPDPRADPAAITALARLRPASVVAVGAQFGSAATLASRVAVAETGRQLPGGGQVMFPGRRLVALYGHPGAPGLGVLGHQDLAASIAKARQMAAAYRKFSSVPVVPAFEIIATVAEASPGPDGSYSAQTPVSELLPWVRQATADGLYVVLDLQPGRASLLTQAEQYQALLTLPDVGLALDPEWKLQPGQRPLRQIGHVGIGEVNGVVGWLAALTSRYHLPQKLLVLHQFQLAMLTGEQHLDTSRDDLAIVIHMDGQGAPSVKQGTWDAVTGAAPRGVFFGWKNFLVKDHPMLTPAQTMTKTPAPVMISYQ